MTFISVVLDLLNMQSSNALVLGAHGLTWNTVPVQSPIHQVLINRGSFDSCLAKFVDMFPSNNDNYDVLFGATDEKEISLHSILNYLVSVNEKIDDIRSYMILQFLNEKMPSDLSKLILKYI